MDKQTSPPNDTQDVDLASSLAQMEAMLTGKYKRKLEALTLRVSGMTQQAKHYIAKCLLAEQTELERTKGALGR